MSAPRLGRNVIYRREAGMGHVRHWWRRHKPLCIMLALAIGLESFAELGMAVPPWGATGARALSDAMLFAFLVLGPFQLALSLARDLRTRVAESILAAGVSPQEYLRGKFFAALRPTFVLLLPLWLRELLFQIRFNAEIGAFAGLEERGLVSMRLAMISVEFFLGALLWTLSVLCYAAIAMALTLRRRGSVEALTLVTVLAAALDVWGPTGAQQALRPAAAPLQDTLIGVLFGLSVGLIFLKYMLYRYLTERSAERCQAWALE